MKIRTKRRVTIVDAIIMTFTIIFTLYFGGLAYGYSEPVWQEGFAQQITAAWIDFNRDIQKDSTDLGITMAQIRLADRIDFILSVFDIPDQEGRDDEAERAAIYEAITKYDLN